MIRLESEIGEKRIPLHWEAHGGKEVLACRDVVISRHAPVFIVHDGDDAAESMASMTRGRGYTSVKVEQLVDVEEVDRQRREAVRARVREVIAQARMDDVCSPDLVIERLEAAGVRFVMEDGKS